jgi:hypothetical protein
MREGTNGAANGAAARTSLDYGESDRVAEAGAADFNGEISSTLADHTRHRALRSFIPGSSPLLNSMPAASNACCTAFKVDRIGADLSVSKFAIVVGLTSAAWAS